MSDTDLVMLSQQGDLQAFNRLARRWDDSLYRFARRMLGNEEDARDVCQEALTKAFQNIQRLRDPARFKSWLYHITLNLCRDRHRSPKSRIRNELYEEGGPGEATWVEEGTRVESPDRAAHRAGLGRVLDEVLEELPDEQRSAILLREVQGFTSFEVAEILGVPAGTVRTRIFYGLKTVRKRLRERGIEGS